MLLVFSLCLLTLFPCATLQTRRPARAASYLPRSVQSRNCAVRFTPSSFPAIATSSLQRGRVAVAPATGGRSTRHPLFAHARPGSIRTSFRQAVVRSQSPPRAASYDPPSPPQRGDVRPRLEPRKKLFIRLHSSTRPRPAFRCRSTLSVPGLLIQPPSQILPCQRRSGVGLPPPMAAAPGGCCPLLYVRFHSYLIAPDVHSLPSSTSCCFV